MEKPGAVAKLVELAVYMGVMIVGALWVGALCGLAFWMGWRVFVILQ